MWSNDTWNGYGTLVLNDGSRVTGHWKKDRLNMVIMKEAMGQ